MLLSAYLCVFLYINNFKKNFKMKIIPFENNLLAKQQFAEVLAKDDKESFYTMQRSLYTFALNFSSTIDPLRASMSATNYIYQNISTVRCGKPEQVIAAFCEACSLGLVLDKASQSAYLVPYKNVIQLALGYRFLLELARREDKSITVVLNYVTKKELPFFSVERKGEGIYVSHKEHNDRDTRDVDNIALVYAELRHAGKRIAVHRMTRKEADFYRSLSPSVKNGKSSPWDLHFYAMWCAKLMRQTLKHMVTMPIDRGGAVDMQSDTLDVEYEDYTDIEQEEQEQIQRFEDIEKEIFDIYDQDAFKVQIASICKQFGVEKYKSLPAPLVDAVNQQVGIIQNANKISIDAERAAYIEKCKSERTKILIAEQMLKNQ